MLMVKKTVKFTKDAIEKLPKDKPVVYKIRSCRFALTPLWLRRERHRPPTPQSEISVLQRIDPCTPIETIRCASLWMILEYLDRGRRQCATRRQPHCWSSDRLCLSARSGEEAHCGSLTAVRRSSSDPDENGRRGRPPLVSRLAEPT